MDNTKAQTDLKALEEDFAIKQKAYESVDTKELTIRDLTLLIVRHKLEKVKLDYLKKMQEWKERSVEIRLLSTAWQLINAKSTKDELKLEDAGTMTGDPEKDKANLRALLTQLQGKGYNIAIQDKYDAKDRERLVESLKLPMDDLSLQNSMTIEELQQSVNERYESYQYARAILKPEHDANQQIARNMAGR